MKPFDLAGLVAAARTPVQVAVLSYVGASGLAGVAMLGIVMLTPAGDVVQQVIEPAVELVQRIVPGALPPLDELDRGMPVVSGSAHRPVPPVVFPSLASVAVAGDEATPEPEVAEARGTAPMVPGDVTRLSPPAGGGTRFSPPAVLVVDPPRLGPAPDMLVVVPVPGGLTDLAAGREPGLPLGSRPVVSSDAAERTDAAGSVPRSTARQVAVPARASDTAIDASSPRTETQQVAADVTVTATSGPKTQPVVEGLPAPARAGQSVASTQAPPTATAGPTESLPQSSDTAALLAPTQAVSATSTAQPTTAPTPAPSAQPTQAPTTKPTVPPKTEPSAQPKTDPTAPPKTEPTAPPKTEPTAPPRTEPTAPPRTEPTAPPKTEPTAPPKTEPTAPPRTEPTARPRAESTPVPTAKPTSAPTLKPTVLPAQAPGAAERASAEALAAGLRQQAQSRPDAARQQAQSRADAARQQAQSRADAARQQAAALVASFHSPTR